MKTLKYDEIGYWSEVKLDIIKDYVAAYTTVMAGQKKARLQYIYIDAFAGGGPTHFKTHRGIRAW